MIIGPLLPLIVLAAIVWAIAAAIRRRRDVVTESGGAASARRLFQYAITYVAFVVAAAGLSGVLGELLADAAARGGASMAGSLAMTVVAVPVYVALARWGWRTHQADATERSGAGWTLYLNAALITALGSAIGSAFLAASNLIEGTWRSSGLAALVVWVVGWAAHWYAWLRVTPGLAPRLHLWVGSVVGLGVAAVSAGFVLGGLGERSIDAVAEGVAVAMSGDDLQLAAAGVVIGAAVWSWHWLLNGWKAERSEGWYITVLLFGVLGGLITMVAGAGYSLYLILEWPYGEPGTTSAVAHFHGLSGAFAAALVGLGIWRYHRAVIGPSANRQRSEIDRAYDYLVAAVGLATMAVALVLVVVAGFEALAPASASSSDASSANTLLAAITLLVVGTPVWATTWWRVQRIAATNGKAEVGSAVRRTYLFAIFGIGGVVAFGALIALLGVVFEAMSGETAGRSVAEDLAVPVALLLTTAAGAVYHWLIYRGERQVTVRAARRDVLLVGDGGAVAPEIAERAQVRVRTLHRLDLAEGSSLDVDAIVTAIDRVEGEHLLVLAGGDEVQVVPYE